ncbi:hypothetical protein SCB49_05490 [unidentified eubacterium SCB49]|nr:hypothetical protein SCB49_05490 [unidentified eubacterium SCB49]
MKTVSAILLVVLFSSFTAPTEVQNVEINNTEAVVTLASFKLINDTGDKVSIYTGTGFVSLNNGSSTSITCNTGKEVRWAKSGKKGDVIFKISSDHCGKTLKLSKLL